MVARAVGEYNRCMFQITRSAPVYDVVIIGSGAGGGTVTKVLADLGIKNIRLLTNNPKKVVGLEGYGLEIVEQLPV